MSGKTLNEVSAGCSTFNAGQTADEEGIENIGGKNREKEERLLSACFKNVFRSAIVACLI